MRQRKESARHRLVALFHRRLRGGVVELTGLPGVKLAVGKHSLVQEHSVLLLRIVADYEAGSKQIKTNKISPTKGVNPHDMVFGDVQGLLDYKILLRGREYVFIVNFLIYMA